MKQNKTRLLYIDCIRVISLLTITMFHFNAQILDMFPNSPVVVWTGIRMVDMGQIGVGMFVIISGASLMHSYSHKLSLVGFYRKRFLSIFPLYWTAYLVCAGFLFIAYGHLTYAAKPWTFFLTLAGLDGFLLYKIPNFYLMGEWFMGMIFMLYIAFPLLRMSINKSPIITIVGSLSLTAIVHNFYSSIFTVEEWRNPISRLQKIIFTKKRV